MDNLAIVFHIATWIAGGIVSFLVKLLREQLKEQKEETAKLRDDLSAHKLYAAETFGTKMELKEMETTLVGFLRRIEDKLDKKADK